MDPISERLIQQMRDGEILTASGERFIFNKNMNYHVFSTENEDLFLQGSFNSREEAEKFQKTLNKQTWIEEGNEQDAVRAILLRWNTGVHNIFYARV